MRILLLIAIALNLSGDEIETLLRAKCGACHDSKMAASGFSIESLDKVILGGKKHGRAVIGTPAAPGRTPDCSCHADTH